MHIVNLFCLFFAHSFLLARVLFCVDTCLYECVFSCVFSCPSSSLRGRFLVRVRVFVRVCVDACVFSFLRVFFFSFINFQPSPFKYPPNQRPSNIVLVQRIKIFFGKTQWYFDMSYMYSTWYVCKICIQI